MNVFQKAGGVALAAGIAVGSMTMVTGLAHAATSGGASTAPCASQNKAEGQWQVRDTRRTAYAKKTAAAVKRDKKAYRMHHTKANKKRLQRAEKANRKAQAKKQAAVKQYAAAQQASAACTAPASSTTVTDEITKALSSMVPSGSASQLPSQLSSAGSQLGSTLAGLPSDLSSAGTQANGELSSDGSQLNGELSSDGSQLNGELSSDGAQLASELGSMLGGQVSEGQLQGLIDQLKTLSSSGITPAQLQSALSNLQSSLPSGSSLSPAEFSSLLSALSGSGLSPSAVTGIADQISSALQNAAGSAGSGSSLSPSQINSVVTDVLGKLGAGTIRTNEGLVPAVVSQTNSALDKVTAGSGIDASALDNVTNTLTPSLTSLADSLTGQGDLLSSATPVTNPVVAGLLGSGLSGALGG